jgi:hypothetical protein
MSVISVARHVQRDPQKSAPASEAAAPSAPSSTGARVAEAVNAVAQFIPTELIGIYVAGAGMLSPLSPTGNAILAIACAALIPLLFWLGAKIPAVPKGAWEQDSTTVWVLMLFSVVAFAAWLLAMPGGPFNGLFGAKTPQIGAFTVVVLAVVLPLSARKFNLTSKDG